jgi:dihydrolipoamide dehydrogenase
MGSRSLSSEEPQFIQKEPEISELARELQKHMDLVTNCEVQEIIGLSGAKKLVGIDRQRRRLEIIADELPIATGRSPNTDILHPEKADIKTMNTVIEVNSYMKQTNQMSGQLAC